MVGCKLSRLGTTTYRPRATSPRDMNGEQRNLAPRFHHMVFPSLAWARLIAVSSTETQTGSPNDCPRNHPKVNWVTSNGVPNGIPKACQLRQWPFCNLFNLCKLWRWLHL